MKEPLAQPTEPSVSQGLPRNEGSARELIRKLWQPKTDDFRISKLGCVYGSERGEEPIRPGSQSLLRLGKGRLRKQQ